MKSRPNRPPSGNFSQLNHDFIEQIMGDLSSSEMKVYLSIYRLTIGFQRQVVTVDRDTICGWSQINVATFHRAVNSLIERGLIAKSPNGGGFPVSYSILFDSRTHATVDSARQSHPCDGDSRTHATVNPDPVLIDSSLKENTKERDNPPTPLPKQNSAEMERPIDKWAADEARSLGLSLRITTGSKRRLLTEADSPELRERIAALLDERSGDGGNVTDDVLALVGVPGRPRRPNGGVTRSRQPSEAFSRPNRCQTDTKLDPRPQAGVIISVVNACRLRALPPGNGVVQWVDLHLPAWKIALLEAMYLQDKPGFETRLIGTFEKHAADHMKGVSADAIIECFFTTEQQRRQAKPSKTDGIAEYIQSLGA